MNPLKIISLAFALSLIFNLSFAATDPVFDVLLARGKSRKRHFDPSLASHLLVIWPVVDVRIHYDVVTVLFISLSEPMHLPVYSTDSWVHRSMSLCERGCISSHSTFCPLW